MGKMFFYLQLMQRTDHQLQTFNAYIQAYVQVYIQRLTTFDKLNIALHDKT